MRDELLPGEDPLQHRLRTMRWPEPPPDVRQRCLEKILAHLDSVNGNESSVADAEPQEQPAPQTPLLNSQPERAWRYECTRRAGRVAAALPAPRRQPRFAAVL